MFGPYRLDGLLGRGGMGEVHRAFDTRKRDRLVALKLLPGHLSVDAEFRARFRREAEIAARLSEPHVIPIHDYGEIDGQQYLDMRIVDGTDLATVLRQGGPLVASRAVAIVEQIAAALDAAHAHGLVHRDVKPSNVLVTEGPPEFVYLADFGIAREVRPAIGAELTGTGAAVGTWEYMAPERFLGAVIDHRADVYALGCLLFAALAARPPYVGEPPALCHSHVSMPVPRLAEHRPGLPPRLDEVIARAMAKQPEHRYGSAGAMASAARRALGAAPVGAPPLEPVASTGLEPGPPTRRRSTPPHDPTPATPTRVGAATAPAGRSHRPRLVALALTLAVVVGATAVIWVVKEGLLGGSPVTVSSTIHLGAGPIGLAVAPDGRQIYTAHHGGVSFVDTVRGVETVKTEVDAIPGWAPAAGMAVAPDGRHLYVTGTVPGSGSAGTLSVIDTATGKLTATIPFGTDGNAPGTPPLLISPGALALGPNGRTAYVADRGSNTVSVIDTSTGTVTATLPRSGTVCRPDLVAVAPDGGRLYVTCDSGTIAVLRTADGSRLAEIPASLPTAVAAAPDGRYAYVANVATTDHPGPGDGVLVVDTGDSAVAATIPVDGAPSGLALAPDGRHVYVLTVHPDRTDDLTVIDTIDRRVTATVPLGLEGMESVVAAPDGRHIYVGDVVSSTISVLTVG